MKPLTKRCRVVGKKVIELWGGSFNTHLMITIGDGIHEFTFTARKPLGIELGEEVDLTYDEESWRPIHIISVAS